MPTVDFSSPALGPEEAKLAELILYVSDRCSTDEDCGATKLNKILHACDFLAYALYGQSITGVEYVHLPQGPAPRRLLPVQGQLIASNRLAIQERSRFAYTQRRPVPLDEANLDVFDGYQVALIDEVIRLVDNKNAKEVSEQSHVNRISLGWQLTRDKETIPYQSVFVSAAPATEDDFARARELAVEHGWLLA